MLYKGLSRDVGAEVSDPFGVRPPEDLTARARIRDAAIALFAERGIGATSTRDIAAAAGVSGGLVRHHFGSKAGLRAACDTYVLSHFIRIKESVLLDGRLAGEVFASATEPALLLYWRYFAQSLLDGSPAADAIFAELVDLSQRWVEEHGSGRISDPRSYAALLVAMELGSLILREQLSRELGGDILSREGYLALARAKLGFYSEPLLTPEVAGRAREAIGRIATAREEETKQGEEDDDGKSG